MLIDKELLQPINPCNDLEKEILSKEVGSYNTSAKNVMPVTQ